MKNVILMLALCLGLSACGGGNNTKTQANNDTENNRDRVEVLYFHGKQRCATCVAIEQNSRAAVEEQFADELKSGALVFRIIDLSTPEGEALGDKYQVTWSSLVVCRWEGGNETSENLTEYAFANARTAPEEFKNGLTTKIRSLLLTNK